MLAVHKLGLCLPADASYRLFQFTGFLAAYNKHTNLMSPGAEKKIVEEHIADSLSLVKYINASPNGNNRLIDIGSGAGFPGMILAIAMPELKVTLVESIEKKCNFLQQCIKTMSMEERVTVLNERAEILSRTKEWREQFSYATARAVGNFSLIAELALPFLHLGGQILAQRSKLQVEAEMPSYSTISRQLGGKLDEIIHLPTDMSNRELCVIVIKKTDHTFDKYPREFTIIQKNPLQ